MQAYRCASCSRLDLTRETHVCDNRARATGMVTVVEYERCHDVLG
jgi:hypothetical protein